MCARSHYFKVACSQSWKVGREKAVRLPDANAATFQMYMDVIHNRLDYDKKASALPLIKLYALGDFLDDVKLRNKAMQLLQSLDHCPSPISIDFLWANTVPGSLLRKWVVDAVSSRLGSTQFARSIAAYPAEFVQQIAMALHGLARPKREPTDYFEPESDGSVNA